MAEEMAHLVESFLNNPLSRAALRFCTSNCKSCGRRMDLCLKRYIDPNVKLCLRCKTAYSLLKVVLDGVKVKMNISQHDIETNLRDPMWKKGYPLSSRASQNTAYKSRLPHILRFWWYGTLRKFAT
jgi:hypothetical protein